MERQRALPDGLSRELRQGRVFTCSRRSHLIFEGLDSHGEVAAWLIDPQKRTLDLIWLTGGVPVYAGPDAAFLRSNAVTTDSFKMESRPAPPQ